MTTIIMTVAVTIPIAISLFCHYRFYHDHPSSPAREIVITTLTTAEVDVVSRSIVEQP